MEAPERPSTFFQLNSAATAALIPKKTVGGYDFKGCRKTIKMHKGCQG